MENNSRSNPGLEPVPVILTGKVWAPSAAVSGKPDIPKATVPKGKNQVHPGVILLVVLILSLPILVYFSFRDSGNPSSPTPSASPPGVEQASVSPGVASLSGLPPVNDSSTGSQTVSSEAPSSSSTSVSETALGGPASPASQPPAEPTSRPILVSKQPSEPQGLPTKISFFDDRSGENPVPQPETKPIVLAAAASGGGAQGGVGNVPTGGETAAPVGEAASGEIPPPEVKTQGTSPASAPQVAVAEPVQAKPEAGEPPPASPTPGEKPLPPAEPAVVSTPAPDGIVAATPSPVPTEIVLGSSAEIEGIPALRKRSRTLLGLRQVLQANGWKVEWISMRKGVRCRNGKDESLIVVPGRRRAILSGKALKSPVPPILTRGGQMFVPVEFLEKILDGRLSVVEGVGPSNTVKIRLATKPKAGVPSEPQATAYSSTAREFKGIPVIRTRGRLLVGLRQVLEADGWTVKWEGMKKGAVCRKGDGPVLVVVPGKTGFVWNSTPIRSKPASFLHGKRLFVSPVTLEKVLKARFELLHRDRKSREATIRLTSG